MAKIKGGKTHCLSRNWEKALKKKAKASVRKDGKKACKEG